MAIIMTLEKDKNLYREVKKSLSLFGLEELSDKLNALKIPDERKGVLLSLVNDEALVDVYHKLDILLYVLKNISKSKYDSLNTSENLLSIGSYYEYDPAKNGQNIIKHGISFSEVISYSGKFGTLMVQCPDKNDEYRTVIFSDLSHLKDGCKLQMPLSSSDLSNSYICLLYTSPSPRDRG